MPATSVINLSLFEPLPAASKSAPNRAVPSLNTTQPCLLLYFSFPLTAEPQWLVYWSSSYFFGLWFSISHFKLCSNPKKPQKLLLSSSLVTYNFVNPIHSFPCSPYRDSWAASSAELVPFSCQGSWSLSASLAPCSLGSGHSADSNALTQILPSPGLSLGPFLFKFLHFPLAGTSIYLAPSSTPSK